MTTSLERWNGSLKWQDFVFLNNSIESFVFAPVSKWLAVLLVSAQSVAAAAVAAAPLHCCCWMLLSCSGCRSCWCCCPSRCQSCRSRKSCWTRGRWWRAPKTGLRYWCNIHSTYVGKRPCQVKTVKKRERLSQDLTNLTFKIRPDKNYWLFVFYL